MLPNPEIIPSENLPNDYLRVCSELVKLDVTSRILCITDLTRNKGNFGFLTNEEGLSSLRIIDFSVSYDNFYTNDGQFEGFLEGNGTFFYAYDNDPTIKFALAQRDQGERAQEAVNFLEKSQFLNAADKAMNYSSEISKQLLIESSDLPSYHLAVIDNIKYFKNKLGLNTIDEITINMESSFSV